MKVDLVIPTLEVGGSERQIAELAIELRAAGVDAQVVALRGLGPLADDLSAARVPIVAIHETRERKGQWPRTNIVSTAKRLRQHWRSRRPGAMQAWLPEAQIVSLPVARTLGIPARIMALRSLSDVVRLSPTRRVALRAAAVCSTAITVNSRAVQSDPGWPTGHASRVLIPNSVRLVDAAAHVDRDPARGVMVANLTPLKGHSVLLEALASLDSCPPVDLVGSGPLASAISNGIRGRGLSAAVALHQGVTNPSPFLLGAQFFVLSSQSEGLPNAVLEAMSAGLPVVAFRVGGIPDVVEDGVSGILAEPGNVPAFAEAIRFVASNSEWRVRAGRAARQRMRELTWEQLLPRHLEVMNVMRTDG